MQHGYQCGMIWGAALAAGAQSFRLHGPGPLAETQAIVAARRLVESFRAQNSEINCLEIADTRMETSLQVLKFMLKGGPIGCFRMAARYGPVAFGEIEAALSEKPTDAPAPPVSCAALLAQKMSVSDLHTVMAAGLAGGIGLCGGACGALGAAVWIIAMKRSRELDGKTDFKDPEALAVVDRFLQTTNYEFECAKIVGRKFADTDDHASYLRDGGCSKIIEALAAT